MSVCRGRGTWLYIIYSQWPLLLTAALVYTAQPHSVKEQMGQCSVRYQVFPVPPTRVVIIYIYTRPRVSYQYHVQYLRTARTPTDQKSEVIIFREPIRSPLQSNNIINYTQDIVSHYTIKTKKYTWQYCTQILLDVLLEMILGNSANKHRS